MLRDNFVFFCTADMIEEWEDCDRFLIVWDVLLGMAECLTPDHEWQKILVSALDKLRQLGGGAIDSNFVSI